jgi:hypothetical protein
VQSSTYSAVDGRSQVDVKGNKVIVTGASTRSPLGVRLGGQLLKALDGINVRLAVLGAQVVP